MPVDSSGNVSRPGSPIPATGQEADAPQVNVPINDIYSILNMLVFLDGRKAMKGNQNFGGYRATNAGEAANGSDLPTWDQVQNLVASIASVPTGSIQAFSGTNIPNGWLRLNGQEVSRADNAALWAHAQASGNLATSEGAKTLGQFGPGNGATTFTLPNLEGGGGQFLRSVSSGRGIGTSQNDDVKAHAHTGTVTIPPHSHSYLSPNAPATHYNGQVADTAVKGRSTASTSEAGGGTHSLSIANTGGTETRPKNVAYVWLIKT
jgi:microcystin-dependent protein